MAKEKGEVKELQQLIALGKERGFLTYEELNDYLPTDVISADQIDDVMVMFDEMDIEIVDDESKAKKRVSGAPSSDSEEEEAESSTIGKTNDPVRMYLREMGAVSLLTRDGEVEIAKRIEKGNQDVLKAVLEAPYTTRKIIGLKSEIKEGRLKIREVVKDLEDAGPDEVDEQAYLERVIKVIDRITKLDVRIWNDLAGLTQKKLPAAERKKIKIRIQRNRNTMVALLHDINLTQRMIDSLVYDLKDLADGIIFRKG